MPNNSFSKIKLMFAVIFLMALTTGCNSKVAEPELPLSIIYGGVENSKKTIFLADATGKRRVKVFSGISSIGYPAVSPDGKQVAFYGKYDKRKTWSIHVVDIDGNNVRRLTDTKHVWDSSPTWSPDGKTIAFAREYRGQDRKMVEEVWLMNPDGTNKRQIKAIKGRSPEFMQDGRLLFQSKIGPSQISISNIDGNNIIQLTNDETNNMSPKISPDGSKIAYLSNRDGNQEVYIMNLDGRNQVRITNNDISEWGPAWSVDGKKIYFSSQNVHGFYDIYKANIDGSAKEKVATNGSQTGSLFHVNRATLESLVSTATSK